jgi:putative ABC transport system permease protein
MLRPRWRKVLSDLWDNKLRTLLVVFSIAVGVFSVGMIAGAYVIISQDLRTSYSSANPANIEIWAAPLDDDIVNSAKNIPDVKQVEGRRIATVRTRNVDSQPDAGSEGKWTNIDLVAKSDLANSSLNLLVPIDGEMLPADQELVLEKKAAEELGAQTGDMLEVLLPNGSIKKMRMGGIVQDQTTSAGDFLAAPLGYITYDTLLWLGQPQNYNRLYATVEGDSDDEAHIRQVYDDIKAKLEKSGLTVVRSQFYQTSQHPMASTLEAILGILGALGILVVLLSSSLIANTLNALLNQHQRHIGVMKLIGARSTHIFRMYMMLILAFSLLALVIAIPLGGNAAYGLSSFVASKLNFIVQGYRIVPLAVVLQVIIALLVPLAAGLWPVIRGSRVTVLRAISGIDPLQATAHKGLIDRGLEKVRFLSRPVLISLRNTFRRKGRLALTLFTLTMGGAIFIAVFNVQAGLEQYIGQIEKYFIADVAVNFTRPYRTNEIEQQLMQVEGVQVVEPWAFVSAEALQPDGSLAENIQILAPPADSRLVQPMLLEGRWIQSGDQKVLTVSEAILKVFPDLKAGDRIKLKINGQDDEWLVSGIFKFAGGDYSTLGFASYDYISEMVNMPRQAFSYRVAADQHDKASQEIISGRIDRALREGGYHVNEVEAGWATMKTASESLNVLVAFLLVMALLTAIVGSIGLAGTMSMNVLERTREIGVMRSIGAVDFAILKTVIFEGLFIGLISYFLAVLLSFPITTLLSTIISLAIFENPIDFAFTYQGFVIWLGVVLILSALASVLPARHASRLTIREVLAYE